MLSARLRVGYASGGMATGAFGTVPGLLLLPYLTDSLGISALIAGLIVFLPNAWDVILNPITGRFSDHFAATHGTRRPFLLWGGIALAVAILVSGADRTPDPQRDRWRCRLPGDGDLRRDLDHRRSPRCVGGHPRHSGIDCDLAGSAASRRQLRLTLQVRDFAAPLSITLRHLRDSRWCRHC